MCVCVYRLSNLDEMCSMGLYINDLNMYDSGRDMVMAGWQHASRLEYSIEKVSWIYTNTDLTLLSRNLKTMLMNEKKAGVL